jgi:ribosomal protein S27AE
MKYVKAEEKVCPNCGLLTDHPPAVRQATVEWKDTTFGLIDVGWYCKRCGHQWGFEVLK